MEKYITVDGGTTNTRLSLVIGENIIDTVKYSVGACTGCSDKEPIKQALRDSISALTSRNGISDEEISRIIASGMITSEGGLCDLPHLIAPVGIGELADGLFETVFPDVTPIPFVFIRGVRTKGVLESDMTLDMMRGEETELFGLSDLLESDCLYVLPGSHTKLIYVDKDQRICNILTTLTGELISAVSSNTILKNSISLDCRETDGEHLMLGYTYAKENGLAAALFKVRVIDKMLSASDSATFSFFLGATLQSDVDLIVSSEAKKVIVGGKRELREPLSALIDRHSDKSVEQIPDELSLNAAAIGAIRIYKASLAE